MGFISGVINYILMGKFFDSIQPQHKIFIEKQKMFFVGSAPLNPDGHVNLSPKGSDCFRVLSDSRVAYMDLIGSGNETSAHLLENGRITFMFCAFDGPPLIMRLYAKGYTILPEDAGWTNLADHFDIMLSTRQIIVADVYQVQTSCGFSVPLYEHTGERDHAIKWAENKGADGLEKYKAEKNRISLDGLPTALYHRQDPS
jgi:hypothetical protein